MGFRALLTGQWLYQGIGSRLRRLLGRSDGGQDFSVPWSARFLPAFQIGDPLSRREAAKILNVP